MEGWGECSPGAGAESRGEALGEKPGAGGAAQGQTVRGLKDRLGILVFISRAVWEPVGL